MTSNGSIANTIHDAIDEVTTTVERIHQSVAALPLKILADVVPFKDTIAEVQAVQGRSIEAVYGLVRKVNDEVRRVTVGAAGH